MSRQPPADRPPACAAARAARACRAPLGSSSERAAFSRNFAANSAVAPSCRTTSACTSSGSGSSSRTSGGSSTSGNRTTKPSSPHSVSTSMPRSSRIFAAAAIAHGAWMRPPRGDSTQTRQSPSSSRTRSTTIVTRRGPRRWPPSDRAGTAGGFPRRRVEIVVARRGLDGGRRREAKQSSRQRPDREAEFERPAGAVALPERHLAGLAGRRRDEDAVVRDLLDPPRGGAEDERLARRGSRRPSLRRARPRGPRRSRRRRGTRRTGRDRGSCRR